MPSAMRPIIMLASTVSLQSVELQFHAPRKPVDSLFEKKATLPAMLKVPGTLSFTPMPSSEKLMSPVLRFQTTRRPSTDAPIGRPSASLIPPFRPIQRWSSSSAPKPILVIWNGKPLSDELLAVSTSSHPPSTNTWPSVLMRRPLKTT